MRQRLIPSALLLVAGSSGCTSGLQLDWPQGEFVATLVMFLDESGAAIGTARHADEIPNQRFALGDGDRAIAIGLSKAELETIAAPVDLERTREISAHNERESCLEGRLSEDDRSISLPLTSYGRFYELRSGNERFEERPAQS